MTDIKQGQLFPPINSTKSNLHGPRAQVHPQDRERREPAGIKTPADMMTLNGAFRWKENERRVIDDSDLKVDYQKLNILSVKKHIVKHKVNIHTLHLGYRTVPQRPLRLEAITKPLRSIGMPKFGPAA